MSPLATLTIAATALTLIFPAWSLPKNVANSLSAKLQGQVEHSRLTARPSIELAYQKTPSSKPDKKPLSVDAKAAIIIEPHSQTVLYEKNSDQKLPMASLAKLMNALTIMNRHRPDETVTIPTLPSDGVDGSQKIGITAGEQFRLSEALRIMLIYSANDMATALAIWDSGSTDEFVAKMNQEAAWWQLSQTTFKNPTGLDTDGQVSSAKDLARLARILLTSKTFSEIVKTSDYQAKSLDGKYYGLVSTNQLLFQRHDVFGIKTGFDTASGQCLITLARRDGNEIVTVALNSPDRFAESKNMIEWAFANNTWQ